MTRDDLNDVLRDIAVEVMRETPIEHRVVVGDALKRAGERAIQRLSVPPLTGGQQS
jgi:hypothetical protein